MENLPDQTGRTALVTGANTGLGRVIAERLGAAGARVFLAGRSRERTMPVVEGIRADAGRERASFLELDLADFEAVRGCAEAFLEQDLALDLLVNNAGVAGIRGETAEGFELHFGINHLGHYLLTNLLLESLRAAPSARVVTVSSGAHYQADGIDFDAVQQPTASWTGTPEYAVSKLANVLFSTELDRRTEPTLSTYAVDPGAVATDIWRNVPWPIRPMIKFFMKSETEGAATPLYCATSSEVADASGGYFADCSPRTPSGAARDTDLAAELWARSRDWTGTDCTS